MKIHLKLFGKEVVDLVIGEPTSTAPDFMSERVGFHLPVETPKELELPNRD